MQATIEKPIAEVDFHVLLRRFLLKLNISNGHREQLAERLGGYKSPHFYEAFFRRKRYEQPLLFADFVHSALCISNNYAVRNVSSPIRAQTEFMALYSALMKVAYEPKTSIQ